LMRIWAILARLSITARRFSSLTSTNFSSIPFTRDFYDVVHLSRVTSALASRERDRVCECGGVAGHSGHDACLHAWPKKYKAPFFHKSRSCDPCGKQHFREIPTPDFVSKCTNPAYYLV
jgi:hypothetical protein